VTTPSARDKRNSPGDVPQTGHPRGRAVTRLQPQPTTIRNRRAPNAPSIPVRGRVAPPPHSPDAARNASPKSHASKERVLVLAIGDVHGDFGPLFRATEAEPAAVVLLQVGDLTAGKPGRELHPDDDPRTLDDLTIPLVWVHGNHEHWNLFTSNEDGNSPPIPGNHLFPGTRYIVSGTGISVVGLPGNYAPTWFNHSKPFAGDRARHFNRDDVEAMARNPYPNILLMHEAFRGQAPGRIGIMGIPVLTQLVQELQPALVLTGHHHLFGVGGIGSTLAIGLPTAQEGYLRLWFERSGALGEWELVAWPNERARDDDGFTDVLEPSGRAEPELEQAPLSSPKRRTPDDQ